MNMKNPVKFFYLGTTDNNLYALDGKGRIWMLVNAENWLSRPEWILLASPEEPEDDPKNNSEG